jgi:hypothetical protein
MQVGVKTWNKSFVEFENSMRILTDVPSQDSFRGFSIHVAVIDECVEYNETITIRDNETGEIKTMQIGEFYKLLV